MAIALRYAARSDVGLVRRTNQDSGYAGPHLLVIADGMGGHAGGDVASSLAIGELAPLDGESHGSDDALAHLERAVRSAHAELLARVEEEPQLAGMGTTVTALLRSGNRLALAHIGDSRAYVLRDGVLSQITKDHTFVQTLVDEGRLTPEEAEHHPQRSVLMRVLSDIVDDPEPDFSMRETRVGDRYLLCSDGLSGVVSFDTLTDTLAAGDPPATTCDRLVALARRAGAPDNVTCIVADVVDEPATADAAPAVVGRRVGAPAAGVDGGRILTRRARSGAHRPARPTRRRTATSMATPAAQPQRRAARRRGGGRRPARRRVASRPGTGYASSTSWASTTTRSPSSAGCRRTSGRSACPASTTPPDVMVSALPPADRDSVRAGLVVDSSAMAAEKVEALRQAAACASLPTSTPTAAPTPTACADVQPRARSRRPAPPSPPARPPAPPPARRRAPA